MSETPRKNFPAKVVREVLIEQGNCCKTCGSFLVKGFHANHIDGDHSNIDKDNCELLCQRCHEAKKYETDTKWKEKKDLLEEQQKTALKDYDDILAKTKEGKYSGTHIDNLRNCIQDKLKISWSLYGEPDYPKPLPVDIAEEYDIMQSQKEFESYTKGYIEGLKRLKINIGGE